MNGFPSQGRLAGVDYGSVRIGIAVSDRAQTLASPLANYTRRGPEADALYFQQLVNDEQLVGFVVGLPVHTSGHESQKSGEVRQFARWLQETTRVPVQFFDERYTTVEATQLLEQAELTRKKRKKRLDMIAAQLILAAFLESRGSEAANGPLED